jgi:hypothetical protein
MASQHPRNTDPMVNSPRCGARTRGGKPCRAPAVHGKRRFRMHGGAPRGRGPRKKIRMRSNMAAKRGKQSPTAKHFES